MPRKLPNVLRQVKIDGKWQRLPMARVNGKIDWGHVKKNGIAIPATSGTFYLEYREKGAVNKTRRAVGEDVHKVREAMVTQGSVLELRGRGAHVNDAPEILERRRIDGERISTAVDAFIKAPPLGLRATTITKYKFELTYFLEWTRQRRTTHLSQLHRKDIKDFLVHLVREQKLELKTAINKAVIVLKLMRDAGAVIAMERGDWPRITEAQPDIYTPEMLKPFFAACRTSEFVLYQTFLLTGFRDQEIGFLAWPDFNFRTGTLRVSKKAGYNFDPKNYMERTSPIHPDLVELLKKHRARQEDNAYFLFPTSDKNIGRGNTGGQRDKHMLSKLKKIALRAGLNCGRCHGMYLKKPACCGEQPICGLWTLHKFRHTYATSLLHEGWDILTVQKLLGHRKIESTMKYLRGLQQTHVQEKMASSSIATMFV